MFWTHGTTTRTWSFLIFYDVEVVHFPATGNHWRTHHLLTFTRPFSLPTHFSLFLFHAQIFEIWLISLPDPNLLRLKTSKHGIMKISWHSKLLNFAGFVITRKSFLWQLAYWPHYVNHEMWFPSIKTPVILSICYWEHVLKDSNKNIHLSAQVLISQNRNIKILYLR